MHNYIFMIIGRSWLSLSELCPITSSRVLSQMMCDQLTRLNYISMLSDMYSREVSLKLLELLSRFGEPNRISNADNTELLL